MKTSVFFLIDFLSNLFNTNRLHVCRFWPTCSVYAKDAIRHYGLMRGAVMAGRRLVSCHPWGPNTDPRPLPIEK